MRKKGIRKALPMLITALVICFVLMPIVSAVENKSTGTDLDRYMIPILNADQSIGTIAISGILSPHSDLEASENKVYGIPFGSIIVHKTGGITQVFDENGKQLLSISDENSEKVPTPSGIEKSCTKVHQLPNDAKIIHKGANVFVFDSAGNLILTVIDETASLDQKGEMITVWIGQDWIESAEDYLNYITEFIAYWAIPSSPPSLESTERIFLFNGILGTAGSKTYLLQPVVTRNGDLNRWEGQAWACHTNGNDDFTGPLFVPATGHSMKGRIYWSSSLQVWSITLYDLTTGQYSSLSTNCMVPQNNCLVASVLEGANVDDNTDVPGDTLFYDMSYKSYGSPMSVDLTPSYSPYVPYEIMQYCWVDIIQDPTRVRLNTYN